MSEANGVDPLLVRALIQVESNYKPKARSPRGAMGLMQLMPSTAKEYSVRNPFDPRANIEAGIKHLKSLIDRFGVEIALAAYNAGEGAVAEVQRRPAVPGDPRSTSRRSWRSPGSRYVVPSRRRAAVVQPARRGVQQAQPIVLTGGPASVAGRRLLDHASRASGSIMSCDGKRVADCVESAEAES